MAQLSLDDVQRHALTGELNRVRVAQLVGRKRRRTPARVASRRNADRCPDHGRLRVGPSMMQNSGPTGRSKRAVSHGRSCSQPHSSSPTSRRRPPLPRRTKDRSAPLVEIVFCELERFLDAQSGAPEDDDDRSHAAAVTVVRAVAHDRHDLVHRRRVGRVAHPLVPSHRTLMQTSSRRYAAALHRPREQSYRCPPRLRGCRKSNSPHLVTTGGRPLRSRDPARTRYPACRKAEARLRALQVAGHRDSYSPWRTAVWWTPPAGVRPRTAWADAVNSRGRPRAVGAVPE